MQHDHQVSKAREKSAGPAIRREASTNLSSDVRAVFELQRTAGNRAVAKLLGLSASAVNGPRAHRSEAAPISLQRDQFDDALQQENLGSVVDYKRLAHALVTGADTLLKEAGTSPKEAGSVGNGAGTAATGEEAALPTKADEAKAAARRAKNLAEMKRLKNLTPEEIKARDQAEAEDDELADWTAEQKEAKEARSSVREAAKLNPEKKSMRSLLKGRSF
jgi:class 3 adenylate cyclase